MKLLDENRRLFGIVNPVDLVAIVLALVAVLVLATVLFGSSPTAQVAPAKEEGTVEIVLQGSVSNYEQLQLETGQDVSRVGGGGVMGVLEKFEITPSQREVWTAEGERRVSESELASDITMVVRGQGSITDVGASIGAERIRQNQLIEVQLPYFQVSTRVVSVEQVD